MSAPDQRVRRRKDGLAGWTFTAWKSQDPTIEEWQGVGRKGGEVKIVTHWCTYRTDAIEAAKASAREGVPT